MSGLSQEFWGITVDSLDQYIAKCNDTFLSFIQVVQFIFWKYMWLCNNKNARSKIHSAPRKMFQYIQDNLHNYEPKSKESRIFNIV